MMLSVENLMVLEQCEDNRCLQRAHCSERVGHVPVEGMN
jgi:hypothetical protein